MAQVEFHWVTFAALGIMAHLYASSAEKHNTINKALS